MRVLMPLECSEITATQLAHWSCRHIGGCAVTEEAWLEDRAKCLESVWAACGVLGDLGVPQGLGPGHRHSDREFTLRRNTKNTLTSSATEVKVGALFCADSVTMLTDESLCPSVFRRFLACKTLLALSRAL